MNRSRLPIFLTFSFFIGLVAPALGDEFVGPDEMSAKAQWVQETLLSLDKPVVSFHYDGKASGELLPSWHKSPLSSKKLSDRRTQHRLEWTDPATGLDVRVEAVDYGDYPAVEWK